MIQTVCNVPKRFERLLKSAVPNRSVQSLEVLQGGSNNLNILVRLQGETTALVLRVYVRNPSAAVTEFPVLRSLRGLLPVPEVVKADTTGSEAGEPYVLYRYLEGVTFQSLKKEGSSLDLAQAAHALGRVLALLQRAGIEFCTAHGLSPRPQVGESTMNQALLGQRLGPHDVTLLCNLFRTWSPRIGELYQAKTLVHGDFNSRNALFQRKNGGWEVAGILDWELACFGSPLWDAARFICYEHKDRSCREPHFSNGFRANGGELPKDWTTFSRVINAISAAEALNRSEVQAQFIPDLRHVVHDAFHSLVQ